MARLLIDEQSIHKCALKIELRKPFMQKTNHLIHLLILVTLILIMPSAHAAALLTHCRTDPIFALSNGDQITVTLDISADEANVRNVMYVVHVPAGVTVKRATFTAGG